MVDTTEFNLVPNNEEEEFTVDFGEVIRLAGSSDFNQLQAKLTSQKFQLPLQN